MFKQIEPFHRPVSKLQQKQIMQLKQTQKTESHQSVSMFFLMFEPFIKHSDSPLQKARKVTKRTTSSDPASSALSNRLWSLVWSKHLSCKCAKAIISSLSVLFQVKVIANWSVGFAFSSWKSCWHRKAERACEGLSTYKRSLFLGYASKQGSLVNITKTFWKD